MDRDVNQMATDLLIESPEEEPRDAPEAPMLAGLLAEFADVKSVLDAAERVRDAGFKRWDVHSPFPIHGIDEAMGNRPTVLPWLVLAGGLFGLVGGLGMQWYMNSRDYPYFVSGKPLFSL